VTPFDLNAPEARRDPYPLYRRLRDEDPVHFSDAWNAWLLTRWADAEAAFRDRRLSANRSAGYAAKLPDPVKERLRPLLDNLSRWTLLLDPPDHTRLRALVNKAFTARSVEAMRPRIRALVAELLERHAGRDHIDVVADLAYPLPTIVIGDMLGIAAEDIGLLKAWSDAIASFMGAAQLGPEIVQRAVRAVVEMEAYLRGVMEAHRREPKANLMSQLLAAEEAGEALTEAELLATCTSLLFGGHETTTNLIGNAVLALAAHPDQHALLRASPDLVPAAIEEVLRWDSPVQRMGRVVTEDLTLHDRTLHRGDRVFMVMGAANRDERQFPDADRFDVTRRDNRHLSFGHGIHFCLGAALGRMEAQLALSALVERLPAFDVDPGDRIDNLTIRGVHALPLRWA
jgi:hypothetical protein